MQRVRFPRMAGPGPVIRPRPMPLPRPLPPRYRFPRYRSPVVRVPYRVVYRDTGKGNGTPNPASSKAFYTYPAFWAVIIIVVILLVALLMAGTSAKRY